MTRDDTIIATSAKVAKSSGTLTAGGASVSLATEYFNEITVAFGLIGVICTVVSLCVMIHYQRKRDKREQEIHKAKMMEIRG